MTNKFFDTSSLLAGDLSDIFSPNFKTVISTITLEELEHLKNNKERPDTAYAARHLLHYLDDNDNYTIYIHTSTNENYIRQNFTLTNDLKILSDAIGYDKNVAPDETVFVTNDLALKNIANCFFGNDSIESINLTKNPYTGYKEIIPTEEELAKFYSDETFNIFNLYINEYLILRNKTGEVIDIRRWDGQTHRYINDTLFESDWFGKVKPYKNDVYQKLAFDCLARNQLVMLRGPAGTGKSMIALSYLMSLLEHNKIDKIIVFCNTVATTDSAKLGYLPGSRTEKLLDSQIGNFLSSKFGGREGVEQLINENKLLILPLSDIRGYDTSGMRAGIYITEAQNMTRALAKLALQRAGEDCIFILDGDDQAQVDLPQYEGYNNGLRRISEVFRGKDFYGEITLKNIYRSKISEIAENI